MVKVKHTPSNVSKHYMKAVLYYITLLNYITLLSAKN
jgi:hypothetical protein